VPNSLVNCHKYQAFLFFSCVFLNKVLTPEKANLHGRGAESCGYGTLANLFYWENYEPNNSGYFGEDYAAMHIQSAGSSSGKWNDYTSINLHYGESYPGIIESSVSIAPLPPTFLLLGSGLSLVMAVIRRKK
jgi:hypothetical protein